MSNPSRRVRRAAERELNRLHRRLNTQPDRPILRAPQRQPPPLTLGVGPATGADSLHPTTTKPPPAVSPSANDRQAPNPIVKPTGLPSGFPVWATLLTLPPDLDSDFRAYLFRYIETIVKPTDDHEHWLAARIAVAMARLHLNARREPADPTPAWLRYEQLADRQLRAAERDLRTYRASTSASVALDEGPQRRKAPVSSSCLSPTSPAPVPVPPQDTPQTRPISPDATFVDTFPGSRPLRRLQELLLEPTPVADAFAPPSQPAT